MTRPCPVTGLDDDVCFCVNHPTTREVDRLIADGHVDPAVADEFAAQVAADLEELS